MTILTVQIEPVAPSLELSGNILVRTMEDLIIAVPYAEFGLSKYLIMSVHINLNERERTCHDQWHADV